MNLINKNDSIFVAGHKGMAGSAICNSLKKNGYKNISVTPIPNKDIGVAINDRLKRSAK